MVNARFSKVELTRAIKAVQDCDLTVRQVSFDENGFPVVECVDNGEMKKIIIDELLNNPSHDVQSIAGWKAKRNARNA